MVKRKGSSRKERPTDIGEYLTYIRVSQGKTQQEIADKIKKSRSCICKIETGARTQKSLRGSILYELAHAYGAPIEDIQRKANWPQLILPLDVTDEEIQELIRHLKQIRRKKKQRNPSSSS